VAYEFIIDNASAPETYLQAAAMLNYYMWYGLYAIILDEAQSRSDWRTVFGSVGGDLQILSTHHARAAAISAITGHEFATMMNYGCGMYVDVSLVGLIKEIRVDVNKDTALPPVLPIDTIFAPVMGGLILGAVSGPYDALQHLTGLQKLEKYNMRDQSIPNVEMHKIVNTYRLFGHDVEIENKLTQDRKTPWATAHECIIEGASVYKCGWSPPVWMPYDSRAREGRSFAMPHVENMVTDTGWCLTIQKPVIRVTEWMKRKITVKPYRSYTKPPVRNTFKILAPYQATPYRVAYKKPPAIKPELGFRRLIEEITPANPERSVVQPTALTGELSVGTGGGSTSALTADPNT
jgi:hypothetical protein